MPSETGLCFAGPKNKGCKASDTTTRPCGASSRFAEFVYELDLSSASVLNDVSQPPDAQTYGSKKVSVAPEKGKIYQSGSKISDLRSKIGKIPIAVFGISERSEGLLCRVWPRLPELTMIPNGIKNLYPAQAEKKATSTMLMTQ